MWQVPRMMPIWATLPTWERKTIKLEQSYNQTRTSVERKKKSPFSEKPFVHTWIPFTLWCFILAKFDCMGDMICMENKIFWSRQCMSFSLSTKTVVHYFIKLEFHSHKDAFRIGMVSAISKSGEEDCWIRGNVFLPFAHYFHLEKRLWIWFFILTNVNPDYPTVPSNLIEICSVVLGRFLNVVNVLSLYYAIISII